VYDNVGRKITSAFLNSLKKSWNKNLRREASIGTSTTVILIGMQLTIEDKVMVYEFT
jgi:hypothetical protein